MQKKDVIINRTVSVFFGVSLFLFILTASIGLPIYCRFFYYIQIKTLNMEATGFTYAEIKEAYDAILNFLTLPGVEFGTGVMEYSPEGMAHFYDCKKLFTLNTVILVVSGAVCIIIYILHKKSVVSLCKPKGFTVGFYSAICALIIPLVLCLVVAIDFDGAFVVFHKLFFPGKDNWLFNPATDEIIKVLPQEFFMNCAIIIAVGLITISLSIIISSVVRRKKNGKKEI